MKNKLKAIMITFIVLLAMVMVNVVNVKNVMADEATTEEETTEAGLTGEVTVNLTYVRSDNAYTDYTVKFFTDADSEGSTVSFSEDGKASYVCSSIENVEYINFIIQGKDTSLDEKNQQITVDDITSSTFDVNYTSGADTWEAIQAVDDTLDTQVTDNNTETPTVKTIPIVTDESKFDVKVSSVIIADLIVVICIAGLSYLLFSKDSKAK